MKTKSTLQLIKAAGLLLFGLSTSRFPLSTFAQGTAFTYQGRLVVGGNATNGVYDLTFTVFGASSGGGAVAGPVTNAAVGVTNGLFSTTLDLGANFPGADRWLEIGVRTNSGGAFTTLSPRQRITPTPYAITASNLSGTVSAAGLGGTYSNAVNFNNAANSFTGNGSGLSNLNGGALNNNSVGSAQLADVIALGHSNVSGQLDVFYANTALNIPAISLSGNGSSIRTYGSDGLEQIRLWGSTWGELLLFDSTASNNLAASLSANNSSGGALVLYQGGTNLPGVRLFGDNIGGGRLLCNNRSNSVSMDLRSQYDASTPAAWAGFYDNGAERVTLAARNDATGRGGVLDVKNVNSANTVRLVGDDGAGNGELRLSTVTGVETIRLNAAAGLSAASLLGNGSGLTNLNAANLASGTVPSAALDNAWKTTGNNGTMPGTQFIGTTDDQALEFKANNKRLWRLEPNTNGPNVIGGHPANYVAPGVYGATIAGGGVANCGAAPGTCSNSVTVRNGTIGGGHANRVSGDASTIAGGAGNVIEAGWSAIGGGWPNTIQSDASWSFIGGGDYNLIQTNSAYSTIGGGAVNTIQPGAFGATIGGGYDNTILSNASYAAIAGGDLNAAGTNSFAAGHRARATHTGSFVWADSTDTDFATTGANQFLLRATGGVGIGLNQPLHTLHVGTTLGTGTINGSPTKIAVENSGANQRATFLALAGPGGTTSATRVEVQLEADVNQNRGIFGTTSNHELQLRVNNNEVMRLWTSGNVSIGNVTPTNKLHVDGGVSATAFVTTSDRNAKENFTAVSPREILDKVAALPISRWNYKTMNDGSHLGPTAQDFYAAFSLGGSDQTITTVDPDGVALAAIQGLNQKVEEQRTELQQKQAELAELKENLADLRALVSQLAQRKNGDAK